jgi:hypothetical protein
MCIIYFDNIKVLFMDFNDFSKPALVEPGIKYFLNETLKQCKEFRITYNNLMFNIGLFLSFMFLLGTILLYKYKGKLTPIEKDINDRNKKQYILSKIKNFQDAKRLAHQELITGLPGWDTDYNTFYKA